MKIKGKIYDFKRHEFSSVVLTVEKGLISAIDRVQGDFDYFILPGLIDSHVHIESSMLVPSGFSRFALSHGVISVVTDPHEISNVLGVEGFEYMINDAKKTPLKIFFGVPSCVPATKFETSGDSISVNNVEDLLQYSNVVALSEMMNFPGVLNNDADVMKKIELAKKFKKPVDGHAPGLLGLELVKYIKSGITTDHEASSYAEALEKIEKGMFIQIREGNAAKNFEQLWQLIDEFPDKVMLCTDDSHPDDLEKGYIDLLFKKCLNKGLKFDNIYKAAFFNPISHYGLDSIGQLRVGDSADFIIVDDLSKFHVVQTYIEGKLVFDHGEIKFDKPQTSVINNFNAQKIDINDILVKTNGKKMRVISASEGNLFTDSFFIKVNGDIQKSDIENDILKIVVLNRYKPNEKPVVGFIKGFGFKRGAIASSIAHDSHNIVAVGVSDESIVRAINKLIEIRGGIVVSDGDIVDYLKLEVAGLMSIKEPVFVSKKYSELNKKAIDLGSKLRAPFMTLSFMSLLVIPKLKIGDKGLFDVSKFDFVSLFDK